MRSLLCSFAAALMLSSSFNALAVHAATEGCDTKTKTCSTSKVKHVQPGLVNWRDNFEAAKTQARTSGKPVLLFVMLGKLDEEFC